MAAQRLRERRPGAALGLGRRLLEEVAGRTGPEQEAGGVLGVPAPDPVRRRGRHRDLRESGGGQDVPHAVRVGRREHPRGAGLALTRSAATERIREALQSGAPGFDAMQGAVADCLDAERRLGRLAEGADTTAIALALVGTVHHLLMTGWAGGPDPRAQAERLVAMLVGGVGPA
ncbi:TetR/AcrR family transcriptional regulator [Streptomyces sp. NPDC093097]|uniref:TetR/AcrR family transcriptional regulator n=1 Tax=Streptomyces sp. NPDC093097 TaxID=3366027 RepID=UPI00381C2C32